MCSGRKVEENFGQETYISDHINVFILDAQGYKFFP
jgi:hypothetical protein